VPCNIILLFIKNDERYWGQQILNNFGPTLTLTETEGVKKLTDVQYVHDYVHST
jgi:hypothetical protein